MLFMVMRVNTHADAFLQTFTGARVTNPITRVYKRHIHARGRDPSQLVFLLLNPVNIFNAIALFNYSLGDNMFM